MSEHHQLIKEILGSVASGVVLVEQDGECVFVNEPARRLLQVDSTSSNLHIRDLESSYQWSSIENKGGSKPEKGKLSITSLLNQVNATNKKFSVESVRLEHSSWSFPKWVNLSIRSINTNQENLSIICLDDISKLKNRERQMSLHAEVFSAAGEAAAITDKFFNVIDINDAYQTITQYTKEEVIKNKINLKELLKQDKKIYKVLREQIVNNGYWQGEVWNERKDGERFPILLTVSQVLDDQRNLSHFVFVFSDITELTLARERLDFLAYHDQLTSLPNRSMSQLLFQHGLGRADRNDKKVALLFIDLDNFKIINDTLGHRKGDFLLRQFAVRLQRILRKEDTVARLGGDEFLIILEDIETPEHISKVANKVLTLLELPFELGEQERFISASIGIAVYPDDGSNFDDLLKHADAAMYASKNVGPNSYQFYKTELTNRVNRRAELEHDLRHALETDSFELFFQPQIDIDSGIINGAEALLRWNHPKGDFVSPAEFIPIIEDTGLIVPVGRWVARRALEELKSWRNQGLNFPRVAINVSGIQLQKDEFLAYLTELMNELQMNPGDLEIEITESVFIDDETIPEVIKNMHKAGFYLALDDFGTGYSSLSYLTRLPFNKIKLDRSFVQHIEDDRSAKAMAESIVALAKTLGFEVIAEGIEEPEQLQTLLSLGCEEAQGFYIGRPVPSKDFIRQIHDFYVRTGLVKEQSMKLK
ncbi:MAG: EAL domain-containing protein [Gammaproteobacteria bacterium]|nr:EAL domain-containing protein [Gammaproteobacteria bacterium]